MWISIPSISRPGEGDPLIGVNRFHDAPCSLLLLDKDFIWVDAFKIEWLFVAKTEGFIWLELFQNFNLSIKVSKMIEEWEPKMAPGDKM